MKTLSLTLNYLPIEDLIALIDEPNCSVCKRILTENRQLFETTPGSRANHQTWSGGYIDHVTDGMNYARHLYAFEQAFGRPMPFSLSDALLVFFLHDLEKPWRAEMNKASKTGTASKEERQAFRERKFAEYGLSLTGQQRNGLTYVEGEVIAHSAHKRMMGELASFCHIVDNWSARSRHDYPKPLGEDEWTGAGRFRAL